MVSFTNWKRRNDLFFFFFGSSISRLPKDSIALYKLSVQCQAGKAMRGPFEWLGAVSPIGEIDCDQLEKFLFIQCGTLPTKPINCTVSKLQGLIFKHYHQKQIKGAPYFWLGTVNCITTHESHSLMVVFFL